jgi:hypothetical protein
VKTALRISTIDLVDSFWRFHVPFLLLRAYWVPTYCDSISFDPPAIAKDRQSPRRFFYDNPVDCCCGRQRAPIVMCVEVNCQRANCDKCSKDDFAIHIARFGWREAKTQTHRTRRVTRKIVSGVRRRLRSRKATRGRVRTPKAFAKQQLTSHRFHCRRHR